MKYISSPNETSLRIGRHVLALGFLSTLLGVASAQPFQPVVESESLWTEQWYLDASLPSLNVLQAWAAGFTGKGVKIAIVDNGIPEGIEDLTVDRTFNFTRDLDDFTSSWHAVKCAGIAAGKSNSICGTGIAFDASIVDIQIFYSSRIVRVPMKGRARMFTAAADRGVDIFSNSYGEFDSGAYVGSPDPDITQALTHMTERGRDGKGSIILWATGNGGLNGDHCAYDSSVNSLYTLGVSGVDSRLQSLGTNEDCSAMMAVVFSQNDWQFPIADKEHNIITVQGPSPGLCSRDFSKSSVAPPMASGVIALCLQANPDLTWRDVQHVITRGSNPLAGFSNDSFYHNAYGFKVSQSFGFGLMNACRMVQLALDWPAQLPPRKKCEMKISANSSLPSNITLSSECSIRYIEHVMVTLDLWYQCRRGYIGLNLISPSGTTVNILQGRWMDLGSETLQLTVKSVHLWGEVARGNWTAEFYDARERWSFHSLCSYPNPNGTLYSMDIAIYGMDEDPFAGPPNYSNDSCNLTSESRTTTSGAETSLTTRGGQLGTTVTQATSPPTPAAGTTGGRVVTTATVSQEQSIITTNGNEVTGSSMLQELSTKPTSRNMETQTSMQQESSAVVTSVSVDSTVLQTSSVTTDGSTGSQTTETSASTLGRFSTTLSGSQGRAEESKELAMKPLHIVLTVVGGTTGLLLMVIVGVYVCKHRNKKASSHAMGPKTYHNRAYSTY